MREEHEKRVGRTEKNSPGRECFGGKDAVEVCLFDAKSRSYASQIRRLGNDRIAWQES